MLESRTIRERPFTFNEAEDTTRSQDALAFCEQAWPFPRGKNGSEQAYTNEIKGVLIEVERLGNIPAHKGRGVQPLYASQGTRIVENRLTIINADDLHFLVLESNILYPT